MLTKNQRTRRDHVYMCSFSSTITLPCDSFILKCFNCVHTQLTDFLKSLWRLIKHKICVIRSNTYERTWTTYRALVASLICVRPKRDLTRRDCGRKSLYTQITLCIHKSIKLCFLDLMFNQIVLIALMVRGNELVYYMNSTIMYFRKLAVLYIQRVMWVGY